MERLKSYFNSKEFLISMAIIVIFVGINVFQYFQYANNTEDLSLYPQYVNCYSFWKYTMFNGTGSILMFIFPLIVSVLSLTEFYYKLKGSYFKDLLLRQKYRKTMVKEFLWAFFKAAFPFILVSMFLFILGYCCFPHQIVDIGDSDIFIRFAYPSYLTPMLFVVIHHVLFLLFILFIVALGFVILRVTKKLSISYIITFISVNALNYLVSEVGMILMRLIHFEKGYRYMYEFNIYEGYLPYSRDLGRCFADIGVLALVFVVIVIICYHNKEKVVRDFE